MAERELVVPDAAERKQLGVFVARVLRLDEGAVVRFRRRGPDLVGVFAQTGFDALASRTLRASVSPRDLVFGCDALRDQLNQGTRTQFDPGYALDSSWRGSLPPDDGFEPVDSVPASAVRELARAAMDAIPAGSPGPPASLLDQEALVVDGGGTSVGVPTRVVFALQAMGFLGSDAAPADDVVHVRLAGPWLRVDARYGSVFRRTGPALGIDR